MPKKTKVETKVVEPTATVAAKPEAPKLMRLADLKVSASLVNKTKAERAVTAANGRPKPQTNEAALAMKFKADGLKGEDLVLAIYKGLGGLVDAKRATQNRENEKKAAKARK